jgi:hypothetical protein
VSPKGCTAYAVLRYVQGIECAVGGWGLPSAAAADAPSPFVASACGWYGIVGDQRETTRVKRQCSRKVTKHANRIMTKRHHCMASVITSTANVRHASVRQCTHVPPLLSRQLESESYSLVLALIGPGTRGALLGSYLSPAFRAQLSRLLSSPPPNVR